MDARRPRGRRRGRRDGASSTRATTPRPASAGRRSASTRVASAFEDLDRFGVAGNHDHGSFVTDYLADLGWTMLDGEVVEGPGGSHPARRQRPALERPRQLARRVRPELRRGRQPAVRRRLRRPRSGSSTILVHDANLADEALERGCVDLVRRRPPARAGAGRPPWSGENGEIGYTYTTGTTGGAAYAIAIGSKPRREATITLLTYRDGRPAGLQPVVLQTDGQFEVEELHAPQLSDSPGPRRRPGTRRKRAAVAAWDPRACRPTARPRTAGGWSRRSAGTSCSS